MGGGGGYRSRRMSLDSIRELEKTAKQALQEADSPDRRSIFISFAHEDLAEVNLLRGQAKNDNSDLDFVDRSLHEPFDSKNAEYIKRGISDRVKQCSVTVVYISKDSATSKWVDWEIRESVRQGKGVIGVYKGDAPPTKVPPALNEIGARIVPWEHDALSKAIEHASVKRTKE